MTILSVTLTNFRGFKYHTVALNELSILVGLNNAGKSTLIDALRLLAVAATKSETANFIPAPSWIRHKTRDRGFTTSFAIVNFDFENVSFNQDRDEVSKLELRFKNKSVLVLWLEPISGSHFVQVFDASKQAATNRSEARGCGLTSIYVMPPIQRVISKEIRLNPDTVRSSSYGRLAYRHFRNQLLLDSLGYKSWKGALEDSWPKLRVMSLLTELGEGENEIHLTLADPPFVSELAWVGSGLQAWMQIVWFLYRTPNDSTIILDEPDAYLHADLQRKLIKILADRRFRQVLIATHSTEIISDVDPAAIVVVRKRYRYSHKPGRKSEVQSVISNLGSRHNLQLSKLAEARRVIIYEGEDQKFLAQIALKISGNAYSSFMMVPYFDVAGVENWREAVGAAKALAAATDNHVKAVLIIDRDFKTAENVDAIRKVALDAGLDFHCWSKKEVENYFVSPVILAKFVTARGNKLMEISAATQLISECAHQLVDASILAIQENHYHGNGAAAAKEHFNSLLNGRSLSDVVGGKRLISAISAKLQVSWGCQAGAMNLCRFSDLADLDDEIVSLVRRLSNLA